MINRCNDYYRSARRTRTVALSDTAVYADGYDWELRKSYYLASSFSMDGLCAIRINGAEISLT